MSFRFMITLLVVAGLGMAWAGPAYAQPDGGVYAPSADIPARPAPQYIPDAPKPQQYLRDPGPSVYDEIQQAAIMFQESYERAKKPRIMILFNRDLEDNDGGSMEKIAKVTGAASSTSHSSAKGDKRTREQAVVEVYQRAAADPNDYSDQELSLLRDEFERPFLDAGARLVDRDIAVRMTGIEVESIFANADLPEAKQGQVAAVREHADIVIVAKVKRGTMLERKVSGDYHVEAPHMVVRAVNLKDANILGVASTNDVPSGKTDAVSARVALALMRKIAAAL